MPAADVFHQVLQAFLALSGWEALATFFGLAYVFLAIKESVWAWPSAFLSTLLYTILFWNGQLPLQALLNGYYLVMAVYGFWLWKRPDQSKDAIHIHTKSWPFHLTYIFVGAAATYALGSYMATTGESKLPYLDAGVMLFSVMNTVLMARKVLENWLYWLVVNSAAIALYWETGFYITIIMFCVYFVMAIIGYQAWRASWVKAQQDAFSDLAPKKSSILS